MKYCVVCKWKDNPNDFQVLEYFSTIESARAYIKTLPKDKLRFEYEIMKYV